jgi:hypothetical protein
MRYSEAGGTLIYEKNLKSKISCQTPLKYLQLLISLLWLDSLLYLFTYFLCCWHSVVDIPSVTGVFSTIVSFPSLVACLIWLTSLVYLSCCCGLFSCCSDPAVVDISSVTGISVPSAVSFLLWLASPLSMLLCGVLLLLVSCCC